MPHEEWLNLTVGEMSKQYEAWKKNVLDTLSATYESDQEQWLRVIRDQKHWDDYYRLTTEAWEKGLYVWYCAFCRRIEWAPAVQMSGCAADIGEACCYPEQPVPAELQSQPEYSMPVPPEGWEMSSQGPICTTCQKVHEYEPPPSLVPDKKEVRLLTCYIREGDKGFGCKYGERYTIVEKQLPCE